MLKLLFIKINNTELKCPDRPTKTERGQERRGEAVREPHHTHYDQIM
jgi:hypothetical protein